MNWRFPYYDVSKGIDWASIEREFEWFRDMARTPQDEIWHAEGNVQVHTKMVVVELINLPQFKFLSEDEKHIVFTAALMHDIEKRSTTTTEERDGRQCIVAPRHSQRGESTAREILYKDIDTPFETREEICALIRYHGAPLWGMEDDNWHQKLVSISLRCRTNLLVMLARADVKGRLCEDSDELLEKADYFELGCQTYNCYAKPKTFKNNLGRYMFLNDSGYVDFEPYDESKFNVHMVSGIAGSGKDYYINQEYPKLPVISLDGIRREFGIKPQAKRANGKVFQAAKERCKVLMRTRDDFVFNATNITRNMRSKWIALFESYGGRVTIHYIEAPYQTLVNQNKNREYVVPQNIIEKMIKKLEIPSYNEAYDIKFNIQEQ
jgi:predicted kinase